jgi:hypothetical protein
LRKRDWSAGRDTHRLGSVPRLSSREAWRRGLNEPPDLAAIGTRGEVDVFGEWVGFEVAAEPLYDPTGARIRA